jgi:hypothetical protein
MVRRGLEKKQSGKERTGEERMVRKGLEKRQNGKERTGEETEW